MQAYNTGKYDKKNMSFISCSAHAVKTQISCCAFVNKRTCDSLRRSCCLFSIDTLY